MGLSSRFDLKRVIAEQKKPGNGAKPEPGPILKGHYDGKKISIRPKAPTGKKYVK